MDIFPLSYSIPDECIITSPDIQKKYLLSPIIPGDKDTYICDEKNIIKHIKNPYLELPKKKEVGIVCAITKY